MNVIGWRLDPDDRAQLLARIPPAYGQVVADHVTLTSKAKPRERAPPASRPAIVGVADDGLGVQALVVEIAGSTGRPDGGTYHITWSLAPNRHAVESNAAISDHGWTAVAAMPIHLAPARL